MLRSFIRLCSKAEATVDLISKAGGHESRSRWYLQHATLWSRGQGAQRSIELAEEWMEIFDRLCRGEKLRLRGKNYKLKAAFSQPHGVQARPVLLNAGRSARASSRKHCDILLSPRTTRSEGDKKAD